MGTIRETAQAALAFAEAATPADWIYGELLDGKRTIYARNTEDENGDNPVIAYEVPDADAMPDLAAFALRVTAPEMQQRIAQVIARDNRGCSNSGCPACQEIANTIMALLTTEGT
jgi:hypothetical protein